MSVKPEPTVLWFRDDEAIEESDRYHIEKEAMGDHHLHVKKLEFADQVKKQNIVSNYFIIVSFLGTTLS